MIKTISKALYWTIIIVLVFIVGCFTLSAIDTPLGFKLYIVQSGSMEPTIKTGSLVAAVKDTPYKLGDIVTYLPKGNNQEVVTHRIVSITEDNGQTLISTAGDANNSPDLVPISESQILGRAFLGIPYLGYIVAFTKTEVGFIVLVVIPATIIIYSELIKIKDEIIKKIVEGRKKHNLLKIADQKIEQNINNLEGKIRNISEII